MKEGRADRLITASSRHTSMVPRNVSVLKKLVVAGIACALVGSGMSEQVLAAPARAENAVTSVFACGIAFELPKGYRVSRPDRSKGLPGEDQCQFNVLMISPKYECHPEGDIVAHPPYDVCDWFSGILGADVAASIVVGGGSLADGRPEIFGEFSFEDGAWRLPDAEGSSPEALRRDKFCGRLALAGTWIYRAYYGRRRTKYDLSEYAGVGEVAGALIQLTPETLVGVLVPAVDSMNKKSLCSSRFFRSVRVPEGRHPNH